MENKDDTIYNDRTLNRQRMFTVQELQPQCDLIQPLDLNVPLTVWSVRKLRKQKVRHTFQLKLITSPILFDHQSDIKTKSEFEITSRAEKQKILTDDKLEVRNERKFLQRELHN